jgi:hypothetical protein
VNTKPSIDELIKAELTMAMAMDDQGDAGPPMHAYQTGVALGVLVNHIAHLHKRIEQLERRGKRR